MKHRALLATSGLLVAMMSAPIHAGEVSVSGDWILLGDVAPVTGAPAEKPIAASPLPGQRLPLAAAFIEMQAKAAGYPVDLEDGSTIWVTRSQTSPATVQTVKAVKSPVQTQSQEGLIPVLTTEVRRGDAITPDMLTFVEPDPDRRIQGLIRSDSLLFGTEATRTIRAGQPLSLRDIQPVSVIKKGDPVQIIYQTGLLRLTVNAKALTSAAKGETVRVMNLQSNRTMDAIAEAPGKAFVGMSGL